MKKAVVFLSLIMILNLISFVPVSAEQQIIAEPDVAAGDGHVLGLNQYGRVFAAGDNKYGQCLTYNWSDVVQIVAGKYFSAGLCSDGRVITVGVLEDKTAIDASSLSDIVQISAGDDFLAALDVNGNVYVCGNNYGNIDTSDWQNVEKIACGKDHVVGLLEDGTCIASGTGSETRLDDYAGITDIYAGANLTVLKDSQGSYYHAGSTIDAVGYEDFDTYWQGRDWENVVDIVIFPTANGNGVVTAIKDDATVVIDNNDVISSEDLNSVKTFEVNRNPRYPYIVYLSNEDEVIIKGAVPGDETEKNEFLNDVAKFDLKMIPLSEVYIKNPQVVVACNTVAIVLPNGQVKGIGKKGEELSAFEDIKQLSADMGFGEDDIFIGVDNRGNTISNLQEDEWLDTWMGILKVAPTVCNMNQDIAVALRWDKRMLYYYRSDSTILEKDNVTDVTCGSYFIAYLTEGGKLNVTEIQKTTGRNEFKTNGISNILRISGGFHHVVGLKADGTCIATGGTIIGGECDVDDWTDISEVVAGDGFTVGLKENGTCTFAGYNKTKQNNLKNAILQTDEADTEYWEDVAQIYSSKNTVVAYKNDGSFEYASMSTNDDLSQLKNTYYKDNTFYTFQVNKNLATVEYYSDKDIPVYFSYFDEEGRPVGFEKKILESVDMLKKIEFENEKSHSFTISIGEPTADKMKFYMEQESIDDTVKIRHCALEGQRMMLAFYDDNDNMVDIKVRTLEKSDAMTETTFTSTVATKYKLFIRDGANPLFKAEGVLN